MSVPSTPKKIQASFLLKTTPTKVVNADNELLSPNRNLTETVGSSNEKDRIAPDDDIECVEEPEYEYDKEDMEETNLSKIIKNIGNKSPHSKVPSGDSKKKKETKTSGNKKENEDKENIPEKTTKGSSNKKKESEAGSSGKGKKALQEKDKNKESDKKKEKNEKKDEMEEEKVFESKDKMEEEVEIAIESETPKSVKSFKKNNKKVVFDEPTQDDSNVKEKKAGKKGKETEKYTQIKKDSGKRARNESDDEGAGSDKENDEEEDPKTKSHKKVKKESGEKIVKNEKKEDKNKSGDKKGKEVNEDKIKKKEDRVKEKLKEEKKDKKQVKEKEENEDNEEQEEKETEEKNENKDKFKPKKLTLPKGKDINGVKNSPAPESSKKNKFKIKAGVNLTLTKDEEDLKNTLQKKKGGNDKLKKERDTKEKKGKKEKEDKVTKKDSKPKKESKSKDAKDGKKSKEMKSAEKKKGAKKSKKKDDDEMEIEHDDEEEEEDEEINANKLEELLEEDGDEEDEDESEEENHFGDEDEEDEENSKKKKMEERQKVDTYWKKNLRDLTTPGEKSKAEGKTSSSKGSPYDLNTALSQLKSSKKVMMFSGLDQDDVEFLGTAVRKLRLFELQNLMAPTMSHLIYGGNKRTIKVLYALAKRAWILETGYVYSSYEFGDWVAERDYESTAFPDKKTRDATGPLFKDMKFFFKSMSYQTISLDELQTLIKLGGGKVLEDKQEADIIIENGEEKKDCMVVEGEEEVKAQVLTHKWILDSLTKYTKLPYEEYSVNSAESDD